VKDPAGLALVAAALNDETLVGADVETTGLEPRTERVRLLSLAVGTVDGGILTYLVDCFAVDPSPLFPLLTERELIFHHAAFDLGFLTGMGFVPGVVHCTMLLAQLLAAGTRDRGTLAACCERYLGRVLDKAEQRSDWTGTLTPEQLAYAAADAAVLPELYRDLDAKVKQTGQVVRRAVELEQSPAGAAGAGARRTRRRGHVRRHPGGPPQPDRRPAQTVP
jgi:DNA polymerase-1